MILLLLIIIVSAILLFLITGSLKKNSTDEYDTTILKNLSIMELAMAALSIILGLFLLFDLIEESMLANFYSYKKELITISIAFVLGAIHLSLVGVLMVRHIKSRNP
jgi:hypothetical protein